MSYVASLSPSFLTCKMESQSPPHRRLDDGIVALSGALPIASLGSWLWAFLPVPQTLSHLAALVTLGFCCSLPASLPSWLEAARGRQLWTAP